MFRLRQLMQLAVCQGKKSWWLVCLLWLVAIVPARAEDLVLRVAIEQDVSQVKIGSSTDATLTDGSGQVVQAVPAMNAMLLQAKDGQIAIDQFRASQLCLEASEGGYVFIGSQWYRGSTCVVPTGTGLTAVNYVDLEGYLYSVVGAEMPDGWHLEALKAQAVAARSYVLYQRQNSANAIFDVGDTTAWQVYGGVEEETSSTHVAVEETRGQVLIYGGQIIDAVFHACAGGYTENVEDVWSSPLPYLRAVRSPDEDVPDCQWSQTVTAANLSEQIDYNGTIHSVQLEQNQQQRVVRVVVQGSDGQMELSGEDVREALGLRSTLFSIEPQRGQVASAGDTVPSTPTNFTIIGRGYGHGIGLSQWGAYRLAQQGYNYQQILLHYYTSVSLALIEVE
ncbi:MAG: SpoIID/LytB domain-containing protein [Cyanobacteria bacterium RU_5_0]|nr:SpoIID/LytB domain-containing protein [Cyanobacteria bacterium RU_5_0]